MLVEKISADMKTAMLSKDSERLSTLRLIRAEFLKAEKEKNEGPVNDERAMAILQSMIKQRRDSIEQYTAANRADMAEGEKKELDIIAEYLPAAMTEEEIAAIIEQTLAEIGEIDPRMTGKIIGSVMGKLKAVGKPFDAKNTNEMIRAKLAAK